MQTLTELCIKQLAKQYHQASDIEKDRIAQSVPPQLLHQFIEAAQDDLLERTMYIVSNFADHVDSWTMCTTDRCWKKTYFAIANDMKGFAKNPRKRVQEDEEGWLEWQREVLPKLVDNSSVLEQQQQNEQR